MLAGALFAGRDFGVRGELMVGAHLTVCLTILNFQAKNQG
jgi:hypothetical protein